MPEDALPPTDASAAEATPATPSAALRFGIDESALIPVQPGQAVNRGWRAPGGEPLGVTWHWTVTRDLAVCRRVLGGANAERKGMASAHYGIGRSFAEGVDRYVSLENGSFHAGIGQTLRWDGRPLDDDDFKGSRSTVGVETVSMGAPHPAPDAIPTASPDGRPLRVQPWTDEQVVMCIEVGREIVARWPRIGPRDHHGHHDICPDHKIDVAGFPFARVLRGIYLDPAIPDVWTPLETVRQRQRALVALGLDLGPTGADGVWGRRSDGGLRAFQRRHGLVENGRWSTFVSWKIHEACVDGGLDLVETTGGPL